MSLLAAIQAERCRRSFRHFVDDAWAIVEPAMPYIDNWHVHAVCDHLQAVADGRIGRLAICMPPGCAKSLLVSVLWPAWMWLRHPRWRSLFGSYAQDLSTRDAVRSRDLITSDWYTETFAPAWTMKVDQNVKTRYENSAGGYRIALSVGGRGTGFRGDCIVVDDPINARDANNRRVRAEALDWHDRILSTRLNDQRAGTRILVMQRLHTDDVAGHVLKREGWNSVVLPMEYRADVARSRSALNHRDPRTEDGDLLFPALFPRETVEQLKIDLGSRVFGAQCNQDPKAAAGTMFPADRLRWFTSEVGADGATVMVVPRDDGRPASRYPAEDCVWYQTADAASKDGQANDWTVVLTAATTPDGDLLIVDVVRAKLPIPKQYGFVVAQLAKWPLTDVVFVEDAAGGTAILQEARTNGDPLVGLSTGGQDKVTRAAPLSILYENGKVFHRASARWLVDFEDELCEFPGGAHDDQVDAAAYAALELRRARQRQARRQGSIASLGSAATSPKASDAAQDLLTRFGYGPPATEKGKNS